MGSAFSQCFGLDTINTRELNAVSEINTAVVTNDALVDDAPVQTDQPPIGKISCCIHHNWNWVIIEALHHITSSDDDIHIVKRQSELPSQRDKDKKERDKPCYALFKVEIERAISTTPPLVSSTVSSTVCSTVSSVWVSSPCLGFLDAKDALCRALYHVGKQSLMPVTSFIPWDVSTIDGIPDLPTHPALLKAALGSGGYGLYFIHTKQQALSIAQAHAQRAQSFDGFLEVTPPFIYSFIYPFISSP